jgi:transposase
MSNPPRPAHLERLKKRAVHLREAEEMSVVEIARRLGVTRSTVIEWLPPKAKSGPLGRELLSPELAARAKVLRDEYDLSCEQIATRFGVGASTIRRCLAKLDRDSGKPKPKKREAGWWKI